MTEDADNRIDEELKLKTGVLNLSKCELTSVPVELLDMEWLTELNLGYNELTKIENLDSLVNLKILTLHENQLRQIENIEKLTRLEKLNLSYNSITEIKNLHALANLQVLTLAANRITEINNLNNLTKLLVLDLTYNAITEIRNLDSLINLQSFGFNANKIVEIENLEALTGLQILGLSDNQITEIKNLDALVNLEELGLSLNQITEIKNLNGLTNLKSLWLDSNKITVVKELKALVKLPRLTDLHLYGIQSNDMGIPVEHFGNETKANCLEVLRAYFHSIKKGVTRIKEVPIILVGNSTAGKTSLLYFLKDRVFPPPGNADASTHGIVPEIWLPTESFINQNMMGDTSLYDTCFYIRDFGGQEYYHATHRLFFSLSAIYIVVWEQKTNKQSVEKIKIRLQSKNNQVGEVEQAIELFPYTYWLNNIRSIATSVYQTPILLVQNKLDIPDNDEIGELSKELKDTFGVWQTFHFSLKTAAENEKKGYSYPDFQQFVQRLLALAKSQLTIIARETYWDKFKEILAENKEDHIWTIPEMLIYLREIDPGFSEENSISYLGSLHHLGYIFYYPNDNDLKEYIFINPDWVIKSIYKLLDYSVLEKDGVFDEAHVNNIVGAGYTPLFIALLKKFELIFQDKEIQQFIAPQYLPNELKDKKEWNKLKARFNSFFQPSFSLYFPDFLSRSIMLRFLVAYGADAIGQVYWKNGISFMLQDKSVLVLCDYEKKMFTVFVEDGDQYIQRMVFDKLTELMENKWLIYISIDGENFVQYAELLSAIRKGNANVVVASGKIIARSAFDHLTEDMLVLRKTVISKQAHGNKMINIFISYAHEDDKIKKQFEIYLQVIRNYYDDHVNVWTDEGIKPGSNWDNKIKKQLETADIIVFLISNNFLASTYIKDTEIKTAIDRFKAKEQIIVPVYIEEVSKKLLPFKEKQYLPGSTPLKDWKPQSKGWTRVQEGIITIIDDIKAGRVQEYFEQ